MRPTKECEFNKRGVPIFINISASHVQILNTSPTLKRSLLEKDMAFIKCCIQHSVHLHVHKFRSHNLLLHSVILDSAKARLSIKFAAMFCSVCSSGIVACSGAVIKPGCLQLELN